MSTEPGAVRARRNAGAAAGGAGRTIAVVGAASGVGRLVAARLAAARDDIRRVVAIDTTRGDLDGVTWRVFDYTQPALVSRLTGCDTVVHAAVDIGVTDRPSERSRRNIRGAQAVLTASAAAGVARVIVVTSAMVYGAAPDNPTPIPEDAALRATEDGGLLSDLLQIEQLCARSTNAHPGMAVTVVRPAMVVGPGGDTVLTRHFEAPRLPVVRGTAPAWTGAARRAQQGSRGRGSGRLPTVSERLYPYAVDARNVLSAVSDAWLRFARENGAPGFADPEEALRLLDDPSPPRDPDPETRFYRAVDRRARG